MMPVYGIPHGGGPCFFMEWSPPGVWDRMGRFLSEIASTLPQTPSALLFVSAHWEEEQFTVGSHPRPSLIYDYYGFPDHTYRLTYPAAGAPALAGRVQSLLGSAGIHAGEDAHRGLDHGVFIPAKVMFPEATVPTMPLSLRKGLAPHEHIAAGHALAALRKEGVLIIGSGMSFHNLRGFSPSYTQPSQAFDDWLTDTLCAHSGADREARLCAWQDAPQARICHPREEHLLPLMVAAGVAYDEPATCPYHEVVMHAAVSAYRFG